METAKEILESKYFSDQEIKNKNGILSAMEEYANLKCIEVLKNIRSVFEMHEQNAASIYNTITFKIEELTKQLNP